MTRAERVSAACEVGMAVAFVLFIGVTILETVRTGRKIRETVDFSLWERESDGL